jgi:hypothetical protein
MSNVPGLLFVVGMYGLSGTGWLIFRESLSEASNKAGAALFPLHAWLAAVGGRTIAAAETVSLKRVATLCVLAVVVPVIAVLITRVGAEGLQALFPIFESRLCKTPGLAFLARSSLTYKLTYGWAFTLMIVTFSFFSWEKIFDLLLDVKKQFVLSPRWWLTPQGPTAEDRAEWVWRIVGTVLVAADGLLFFVGSIYSADWLFNAIPPVFSGLLLLAVYLGILLFVALMSSLSKR